MSSLFTIPKQFVLDNAGDPIPAARLYFYETQTTTPKSIYSDVDLNNPHTNPVVSDAFGVFPQIWLDGDSGRYTVKLTTSALVERWTVDDIGGDTVSAQAIGEAIYPVLPSEGTSVVRGWIPYGWLTRYTLNDGDGINGISTAFYAMISCGAKLCHVPFPETSWCFDTPVVWDVLGVTVRSGKGTKFNSKVASGQWTIDVRGVTNVDGGGFIGFDLTLDTPGCNGIRRWETDAFFMDQFRIDGVDKTTAGKGMEINGGDDASATYGSAFNVTGSDFLIQRCGIGIKLATENTTNPTDDTAFCNRNIIGFGHVNQCLQGIVAARANTNVICAHVQGCTEGWNLDDTFKSNNVKGYWENCTRPCVIDPLADDNHFSDGVWTAATFVNSSGTQIAPHVTCSYDGTAEYRQRRNWGFAAGAWRITNPDAATALRIRADNGVNVNLLLGSHDSANTNFDLLGLMYDATAPYLRSYERHLFSGEVEMDGALNHDGTTVGFYGTAPIAKQTGVAETSAAIKAALVALGLIT